MTKQRNPSAKSKSLDVEAEMNAKDAFAANLQAKLKSLRQLPQKKKVVDEEDFVGLTRKVKRKRVDNATDDVPEELTNLVRKPASNGVKPSLVPKTPVIRSSLSTVPIAEKKPEAAQETTSQNKSPVKALALKKKSKKKKKIQKIMNVNMKAQAYAAKAPVDTNSLFPTSTPPKVPLKINADKPKNLPLMNKPLKQVPAMPKAASSVINILNQMDSETSSDEEQKVKKTLVAKLKPSHVNDSDSSSDEEKTIKKSVLVKPKAKNESDSEASSDEEKTIKKPILVKPKPNIKVDTDSSSDEEKPRKKSVLVKSKPNNDDDSETSSDEEKTLRNSINAKLKLNDQLSSETSSEEEKPSSKPVAKKSKLQTESTPTLKKPSPSATPKPVVKSQPVPSKPIAKNDEPKSPLKPIAKKSSNAQTTKLTQKKDEPKSLVKPITKSENATKVAMKTAAAEVPKSTKQSTSKLIKKQSKQVNTKPAKNTTGKPVAVDQSEKSIEVVTKANKISLEEAAKAMKRLQTQPKENTIKIQDIDRGTKTTLYASIIDAAAMEQWDLVEMGRLVRLFCAPFHFKRKKTTRFLRKHCPEFVCADFLEGLDIPLHGFQIIELLRAGSPAPHILSAKIATCIEADVIKISDDSVLEAFVDLIDLATMSKDEIFDFAHSLVESLRTVEECCRVLKGMTQHWALEDIRHLVQRVILSPVFDDLEGDHEATVNAAFPMLSKLEFPSRLDMEDTNADGNLDDLCVDDDTIEYDHSSHESDDALDEMEARIAKKIKPMQRKNVKNEQESEDEDSDKDTDEDDNDQVPLESDSEEDDLPHWNPKANKTTERQPRQRCRFILDEASEDESMGEDDSESSDSGSD